MSVLLAVNIAPIMETFPRLSNAVRTEKSYFAEMRSPDEKPFIKDFNN